MRTLFVTSCFLASIAVGVACGEVPFEDGLQPKQLIQIIRTLPSAPIGSIQFFREKKDERLSAIILSLKKGDGWQLRLISPRGRTSYSTSWVSEKLSDSFSVSSPTNLSHYWLKDEGAIVFTGCAPHMCPDIFSALLYVPSRHRAFVGTCNNGQVTYTFSPSDEGANEYKEVLNETLQEIDGHGSGRACSSENKGKR